jgi:hypothetical protein
LPSYIRFVGSNRPNVSVVFTLALAQDSLGHATRGKPRNTVCLDGVDDDGPDEWANAESE